jgi:rare lipoprotein A
MKKYLLNIHYALALFMLVGCTPLESKYKGHYKVGSSYKIKNKVYTPREVTFYKKEGLASWYGPKFHGKKTANGEVFNRRGLTAAHQTLPLPSVVKVTNLKNNKSVVVIVNDRGPFSHQEHMIIDLSEKAAEIIDMKKQGIAKVKVELLPNTTSNLHKKLFINKAQLKIKIG